MQAEVLIRKVYHEHGKCGIWKLEMGGEALGGPLGMGLELNRTDQAGARRMLGRISERKPNQTKKPRGYLNGFRRDEHTHLRDELGIAKY